MKTLIAQALVTQCFSIFFVSLSPIITLKGNFYPFFTPKDLLWKTNQLKLCNKKAPATTVMPFSDYDDGDWRQFEQ